MANANFGDREIMLQGRVEGQGRNVGIHARICDVHSAGVRTKGWILQA